MTSRRTSAEIRPLLDRLKLTFASWFKPDIKMSDQGKRAKTSTFSTIAAYLRDHGLAKRVLIAGPDDDTVRDAPF